MLVFRKLWHALFSCYLRFETRPSAILVTSFKDNDPAIVIKILQMKFELKILKTTRYQISKEYF